MLIKVYWNCFFEIFLPNQRNVRIEPCLLNIVTFIPGSTLKSNIVHMHESTSVLQF